MNIRKISLSGTEQVENFTVYLIEVFVKEYSWVVKRRYREFHELHEQLVKKWSVKPSLLPPKRVFGNLQPQHVEKRKQALEAYLETLLDSFQTELPPELQEFIEVNKYDVCGAVHALARELFHKGDNILSEGAQFTFTPLQLHCITSRLLMAIPTCDSHIPHGEVGNVYDFIQQLKHLRMSGRKKQVQLSDNVVLKCNLALFKSLETIQISSCDVESLQGLGTLQSQITKLSVHHSVRLLKDILVDEEIWERGLLEEVHQDGTANLCPAPNLRAWSSLTEADFSKNDLPYIDESVTLLPNVEVLKLSHNCLENIEHLQALSGLVHLDLSHNKISTLGTKLNVRLGNVRKLNLAGNQLQEIEELEKLYSLVALDLSHNNLEKVTSVLGLGQLPCLETLELEGNPLTRESMARIRVLSAFEERAEQIRLDGQKPTQREMSKVREIIVEEQSFEIVNFPTPPQSSKPKPGHKKSKSIDRVIALEPGEKDVSLTSTPASGPGSSPDAESDAEFRCRVEKMRQLGGDRWLRMYEEIQSEDKQDCGGAHPDPGGEELQLESMRVRPEPEGSSCSADDESGAKSVDESDAGLPRLHFGFPPKLEELIHEKREANSNTTSGTFMVEVEAAAAAMEREEVMVGVDLSKGIILEVQISTGRTSAKHRLVDISSVDILDVSGCYYVDIRDVYSKEWRRHRTLSSEKRSAPGLQRDYRHVARYRMRSIDDAAELFVLLYKFITHSWESSDSVAQVRADDGASAPNPFTERTQQWPNPLGIPGDALQTFFVEFLRDSRATHEQSSPVHSKEVPSIYATLHTQFLEAGSSRHVRTCAAPEEVLLVLWAGCLPYAFPEYELPTCLVMTDLNMYLFHVGVAQPGATQDLRQALSCFVSFSIRDLKQVVFGLYDQGFRLELRQGGPKATFTILTRDADKTGKFFEALSEALGEPVTGGGKALARRVSTYSSGGERPSFVFPDEEKLVRLKEELSRAAGAAADEDLLMYTIVREVPDSFATSSEDTGDLTRRLRSLIVTNSRMYLCDEDHVHWPLPSFVRAPPSTPQWVVTKSQQISRIIGIDLFERAGQATCQLEGVFGLSLIFEADSDASPPNCWHLMFRAADERHQLQRSLAQVWKDHFCADLKVTHSKTGSCHQADPQLPGLPESVSSVKAASPVGTPLETAHLKKTHRRVGSDSFPMFKASVPDSLESLATLDRASLDTFFHRNISQKDRDEEEILVHVLWTGCTPYLFPLQEFKVCVLLSSLFVYLLADREHKNAINKRKETKLRGGADSAASNCCFCLNFLAVSSLRQVCVGLFDQTVRIEADSAEDTFTLITRDFHLTSLFVERLNAILASELGQGSGAESESIVKSIYDTRSSEESRSDGSPKTEFLHSSSGVRVIYPNEDTLEILKDAIVSFSQASALCAPVTDVTILVYLLMFHEVSPGQEEPRTLVISDRCLSICLEDHVNYPLTLFATGLPDNPQYQIQDVRDIASLSRVEFSDFNSCDFTLVFAPPTEKDDVSPEGFDSASIGELCVIVHHDAGVSEECTWRLVAQTYEEKEKALSLICKLWADFRGGALPVMKA